MASVPNSVSLASIATDSEILSSDHRNNYLALQTFINALQAILVAGASGQVLTSGGGSTVSWAASADAAAYRCRVRRSVVKSIPSATYTAVDFDTEDFDTDTMHDTGANTTRITIQHSGIYVVTAQAAFANPAEAGTVGVQIKKNGTTVVAGNTGPGYIDGVALTYVDTFAATDYLEMFVYQAHVPSPGAVNTALPMYFSAYNLT